MRLMLRILEWFVALVFLVPGLVLFPSGAVQIILIKMGKLSNDVENLRSGFAWLSVVIGGIGIIIGGTGVVGMLLERRYAKWGGGLQTLAGGFIFFIDLFFVGSGIVAWIKGEAKFIELIKASPIIIIYAGGAMTFVLNGLMAFRRTRHMTRA